MYNNIFQIKKKYHLGPTPILHAHVELIHFDRRVKKQWSKFGRLPTYDNKAVKLNQLFEI